MPDHVRSCDRVDLKLLLTGGNKHINVNPRMGEMMFLHLSVDSSQRLANTHATVTTQTRYRGPSGGVQRQGHHWGTYLFLIVLA